MGLRTMIVAAGVGAGTMYLLDPEQGPDRRARISQWVDGLIGAADDVVVDARDVGVEAARVAHDARDAVADVAGAATGSDEGSGSSFDPTPGA